LTHQPRYLFANSHGRVDGELVDRFKDIWIVTRAEYVPLLSLPFWLIDGINPVLDFHDNAAVVSGMSGTTGVVEEALR
jgi:hypothetical protein